jgi:hypothetical protein
VNASPGLTVVTLHELDVRLDNESGATVALSITFEANCDRVRNKEFPSAKVISGIPEREGLSVGIDEGRSVGIDEGLSVGIDRRLVDGIDEGLSVGVDEGFAVGIDEGLSVGANEGFGVG